MSLLDALLKYASPAKKNRVCQYDMAINQARTRVLIKDAKSQSNTVEQHIKVTFNNFIMPMDKLQAGCKFLVVPTNEVAMVREKLQAAVNQGEFDEQILAVQKLLRNRPENQAKIKGE